ncbi:dTDP-4-dehydrorhamnose 3,5-epimerase [Oligosphaera ethanolica]|uniref:dTDP-4-dehydrorhamnose 3,5-epimerase n=1 Tax=Oligosphaera ethanolica TaxID=760260 RepID=A0AAE4APC9_9BACT|nr:dTDP-4-dehydrorhamnose 3,5-epimerase [Oligosphaera ethanolica]MDQ0289843.1 dTDP-4-dehydrorhamnose 3,5-epimerase [Oligosphaera ethanolica]
MNIIKTKVDGVVIIVPKVFGDTRGYFFESWKATACREAGIGSTFIQDNESKSCFGVLRGLHYQAAPYTQSKLVRVVVGAVLDVAVDIRRGSPTFGQHVAVELSGENKRQMFIPRGFAHGFVVLSDEAIFAYKCDNDYMPSAERGICADDPALGIDWRIDREKWVMSPKDQALPMLANAEFLEIGK